MREMVGAYELYTVTYLRAMREMVETTSHRRAQH